MLDTDYDGLPPSDGRPFASLAVLAGIALIIICGLSAAAFQTIGDQPPARPTLAAGSALWTVRTPTFVSSEPLPLRRVEMDAQPVVAAPAQPDAEAGFGSSVPRR